jgi:triosephosphate isomerase
LERKKLVIGNWKMHLNASQASLLVHRLQERIESHRDVEVVLAPSHLVLQPLSLQIDRRKFKLAAQNCHWQDEGAFTGEVSATMLHDLVHYVIVGHSERRHIFGETDDMIAKKVASVVRNGITPVLCVGETAEERKAGETKQVLHDQLMVGLKDVTSDDVKGIVIAYEPVWAIGTGHYAKPGQVKEAVGTIRHNIRELYGHVEDDVRVLYGGSVEPDITRGYIGIDGVDGLLVGGASLNYEHFSAIVATVHKTETDEEK